MQATDIILIVAVVVVAIVVGFYFLSRRSYKKMNEQQKMIDQNKMTVSIFVIDKKRDKPQNANMPKAVIEALPRYVKLRKANLVLAKVGPQVATLMCDKKVYEAIPTKKTIKVELAGMYILGIKGSKPVDKTKKEEKSSSRFKFRNPFARNKS